MTTYPAGVVLPAAAADLVGSDDAHIWYTSPDNQTRLYLAGPLKCWPGIHDGITLAGGLKNLTAAFNQVNLKSARQPGVTWTATVWDQLKIGMHLQAHARTPRGMGKLISEFIGAFPPDKPGTLEWITRDRGYWYCNPRRSTAWPDSITQLPRTVLRADFSHTIETNDAFWYGMPTTAEFIPASPNDTGFVQVTNIGDQDAAPSILCVGPGTFSWSNGDSTKSSTMISFGPLEAGQSAIVMNSDRQRNVIDLTAAPQQALSPPQKLIEQIVNYVSNNNVPPLLQQFESLFGILPPQGPLGSLLTGRYTNPIPGVAQPQFAQTTFLKVAVTGAAAGTKMIVRLDPRKVWPE